MCDVSPPVVRRWLSLGLISVPPWTIEQADKDRQRRHQPRPTVLKSPCWTRMRNDRRCASRRPCVSKSDRPYTHSHGAVAASYHGIGQQAIDDDPPDAIRVGADLATSSPIGVTAACEHDQ
jgi:hypothetical protein